MRCSRPRHEPAERGATRRDTGRLALVALLALAAPTAGDIGSCGQSLDELDPVKFFTEKRRIDCQHCVDCLFQTAACEAACANQGETSFPAGCYPLVHDGEVCLDALAEADCERYQAYVDDTAPQTPSECNFCPLDEQPEEP